jgi:tyrosyl-tRNA synthetase
MDAKRELAKSIIRDFRDAAAADAAEEGFRRVFSDRQAPVEMEETSLPASPEPQSLFKIVAAAGLSESNKDAQRVIAQGGVLVDDAKVSDSRATLDSSAGKSYVLKVGKRRFARVTFI